MVRCLLAAFAVALWIPDASADQPRSLSCIPSDASFFFGIHKQAALFERFYKSELAAVFAELDEEELADETGINSAIEIGQMMFPFAVEFPIKIEDSAQAVDMSSVASQMLQSDAFLYGDANWVTTFDTFTELNQRVNEATLAQGEDFNALEFFLSQPDELIDKLRLPSTAIAFDLTDQAPAERILDFVHQGLQTTTFPDWVRYRGRTPMGKHDMLVFSLKPWEADWFEMTWDGENQLQASSIEKFNQLLEEREIIIAVGVLASRLTFCIGESRATIERMLTTEQTKAPALKDVPQISSVLQGRSEDVVLTAYVSEQFSKAGDQLPKPNMMTWLGEFISSNAELFGMLTDESSQQVFATIVPKLTSGLENLGNKWDEFPRRSPAGWAMAIFANDKGLAGKSVTNSIAPSLPDQGLDVHQFVGGKVLFQVNWQTTHFSERVLLVSDAIGLLFESMMDASLAMPDADALSPNDQKVVDKARELLAHTLGEFKNIVREQVVPSLHEGGHAFATTILEPVDFENTEKSPFGIHFLTRVRDVEKLKQAGVAMRNLANRSLSEYLQIAGEEDVPAMIVPPVEAVTDEGSTVYYASPEFVDTDDESDLEAHIRLTNEVLIAGSNIKDSKRLVDRKPTVVAKHPGTLRFFADFNLANYAEVARQAIAWDDMSDEDREETEMMISLFEAIGRMQCQTRTDGGQTVTRWSLPLPLKPAATK